MERNENKERLFDSLCEMIRWTQNNQKQITLENHSFKRGLSKRAWAKEYCSIKFGLPRQSGHSTMIGKLCSKDTSLNRGLFENPAVIHPNYSVADYKTAAGEAQLSSFSDYQKWDDKFYGKDFDAIIVDVATCLSQAKKEMIYEIFEEVYKRKETFVFLFME